MDCHVFRRLCDELAPALMGCRIEKIHRPAKDVTLFTLYGTGGKRQRCEDIYRWRRNGKGRSDTH